MNANAQSRNKDRPARIWPLVCSLVGLMLWSAGVAAAPEQESRVALLIGNAAYDFSPLTNPVNDVRAMSKTLTALGFEVTSLEDAGYTEMVDGVRRFGDRLRGGGGVALFYFAGHGVQMGGINYLIPIGSDIRKEHEVKYNALNVNQVVDEMDFSDNRVNIVVLDACRNNPFARSFRSAQSGLAQIDAPSGTLIAFATAPGEVANDGSGDNGLYTEHLLANISKPGLAVEQVFKHVRVGVLDSTRGEQVPWESSSLVGDFYFIDPKPAQLAEAAEQTAPGSTATAEQVASLVPSRVDPKALDLVFWESVKDSRSAADFEAYLEAYPEGVFAGLAQVRLQALGQGSAPSPAPSESVVEEEPKPVQEPQKAASDYLTKARAALAAGRLLAPAGDNAVEWSARELARKPRSGEARGIIRDVFDQATPKIAGMLREGRQQDARKMISVLRVLEKYASQDQLAELDRLETGPIEQTQPSEQTQPIEMQTGLASLPSPPLKNGSRPAPPQKKQPDAQKSVWSFPGAIAQVENRPVSRVSPKPASVRPTEPVSKSDTRDQVSESPISMGGGWVTMDSTPAETSSGVQWQLLDSGAGNSAADPSRGDVFSPMGGVNIEAR